MLQDTVTMADNEVFLLTYGPAFSFSALLGQCKLQSRLLLPRQCSGSSAAHLVAKMALLVEDARWYL